MNHKKTIWIIILTASLVINAASKSYSFGFFAHRKINRMAVFMLPPEMFAFYKKHIEYLTEHAIDPDKRSRVIEGEDKKHYIDLEYYGSHPFDTIPFIWKDAVSKFTEDTLQKYGTNPWWVNKLTYSLTQAFKEENLDDILYISANIGHYIADACTPLHTTQYYDGRTIEQKGIHAFWETRIPELEADSYNFMLGRAEYIDKPNTFFWKLIRQSHEAVDTIFMIDSVLSAAFPEDKKYVYEERLGLVKKLFSKEYADEFELLSKKMVERRMKTAVRAVAGVWLTAWINAGQPDLARLEDKEISKAHQKELDDIEKMWKTGKPVGRPNPE
ncbi:MAG: zinc dependent phospholipase C family protein [Bacteroidota bacterium]